MRIRTLFTSLVVVCGFFALTAVQAGPPIADALWADGQLYRTILTPTELPNHGPKDGLFVFPGLAGQRGVAEAKPGDRDYNGGRWQVYVINVLDESALSGELTSWEEVQMHISNGALEIGGMGPTFVCPMIK
jgi:hypothetical protein